MEQNMNAFEQRYSNDLIGLTWINRFGWLRTAELGQLIWPNDTYARTRTDRIARGWIARELVIPRKLPDGAGRALVLSARGARLLTEAGIESGRGTDIGLIVDGGWQAPDAWRHDLIATGVLVDLYCKGYEISTERELRRKNGSMVKIPDGLAWNDQGHVLWLEAENARKTGKSMSALAQTICTISAGGGAILNGKQPTNTIIAFVVGAVDERRYHLDHKTRVSNAIGLVARRDINLIWAACNLLGCGVDSIVYEERAIIHVDFVNQILQRLNNVGWCENEDGCYESNYGEHRAFVWDDDVMGWSYFIDSQNALCADTKAQAMRGCAGQLAAITGKSN
jgi:hypothetical protein